MAKTAIYDRIGATLKDQGLQKAHDRAKTLFGDPPPGTTDMSKGAFLNYCRRNWPDAGFRSGLLERIGPENFRDTVIQIYHGDESVWPMPHEETA